MKKIILLILIAFCGFSCNPSKHKSLTNDINEYLLENIENPEFTIKFDTFSSIDFSWDELIVVGPYVDLNKISVKNNYNFSAFPTTIKSHDNYVLMGFIKNKIGVKYIEINRYMVSDNIFIDGNKNFKIYPKENSHLKIIKKH